MRVVGLISGTSADGIDGALVEVYGTGAAIQIEFLEGTSQPYEADLQRRILALAGGATISLAELAELDDAIATAFATTAKTLMHRPVDLIASHGQTVFHRPATAILGYSLQLGRGAAIAAQLGVPTVSDFRKADIVAGGQGAPLVSPVDVCLFSHPDQHRCIQNIGGIGNLTYLPPRQEVPFGGSGLADSEVVGWDTGPGNSLLDIAVHQLSNGQQSYDPDGTWAAQGEPHGQLLQRWLSHPYFHQPPPKSTGRELFGWEFYRACVQGATELSLSPADLLATLTEFTAVTIAQSYRQFLPHFPDQVFLCGGGSHNAYLVNRLQQHLAPASVATTSDLGVPVEFKEAIAFAVLGYWRWQEYPGNLPAVTGASRAVLLGDLFMPNPTPQL
ncbi:anhydro-N-acetylmuramic acid kinase [filamentous cyanobacterium CCP5]|nr:anhydro-N-acetylmuramic acid kinase [filamentous cyanobacterium CCP5]